MAAVAAPYAHTRTSRWVSSALRYPPLGLGSRGASNNAVITTVPVTR